MIAEAHSLLATLSREDKWVILHELKEELCEDEHDLTESVEQKAAIKELLDYRWQQYLDDPSTSTTWVEVQKKMHARRDQRMASRS